MSTKPFTAEGFGSAAQWAALLLLSVVAVVAMEVLHVPAAFLLGPLMGGIILALRGVSLRVPRFAGPAVQSTIGCMVAMSIHRGFVSTFIDHALLFIGISLWGLGSATLFGWLVARFSAMSNITALLGFWPGGSPMMVLLATTSGGDPRVVAMIQYCRVLMVALGAGLLAHVMLGDVPPASVHSRFAIKDWGACAETLVLGIAGAIIGKRSGIPSGAFFAPVIAGGVLQETGIIRIELPFALLALAYVLLGWQIGLSFTRQALRYCARMLPLILSSTIALIGICAAVAVIVSRTFGIDLFTAFLATSPGGIDSVMILAAAGHADIPLVLAAQLVRFLLVMATASWLGWFLRKGKAVAKDAE